MKRLLTQKLSNWVKETVSTTIQVWRPKHEVSNERKSRKYKQLKWIIVEGRRQEEANIQVLNKKLQSGTNTMKDMKSSVSRKLCNSAWIHLHSRMNNIVEKGDWARYSSKRTRLDWWSAKNSIKAAELSIQHENGIYVELDKHNVKLKCPQVMHSDFEYWTTKSSQPKILKAFRLYSGKGMFWICSRNLPLALHESEARSTQTLHSTAAPGLPDYPRPSEDSKMFKHATFHPSRDFLLDIPC